MITKLVLRVLLSKHTDSLTSSHAPLQKALAAGGVLYDYTSGSAPAKVLDSYFFIYNKDHTVASAQPSKSERMPRV